MKTFCNIFPAKLGEYEALLTGNRIWLGRTKGVGVLNTAEAIEMGVTGPVLRASGLKWDIRKAQPYAAYEEFDFDIPVGENGDTFDRYVVRMEEMRQSLRIIEQAVSRIPEGPVMARVPKILKPPAGEVYHSIEAPKGELGYFVVSDGSTQPYRVRISAALLRQLAGTRPDGPGALGGGRGGRSSETIDIVLGEVDR